MISISLDLVISNLSSEHSNLTRNRFNINDKLIIKKKYQHSSFDINFLIVNE